jgi:hypothetical protein
VIIVSDTSPLSNLAVIGQISLLKEIYHQVVIPQAVADELASTGDDLPEIKAVLGLDWITVGQVTQMETITTLQNNPLLDIGEIEAITLALELKAEELLIDERIGRQEATHLGIAIIGILGILLVAKRRNLISNVKPVMNALISEAGFRVSRQLYEEVLEVAGESTL